MKKDKENKNTKNNNQLTKRKKGGQLDNKNAYKHGIYSEKQKEQKIYNKKVALFTKELKNANIFDEQMIQILSIISTKFDMAISNNAQAEALIPLSNEILKLLRSLKETRDTRAAKELEKPKSAADFLLELVTRDKEKSLSLDPENLSAELYEIEKEINELSKKLDMSPSVKDELSKKLDMSPSVKPVKLDHKIEVCSHCKKTAEHRINLENDWVCMECGNVVEN